MTTHSTRPLYISGTALIHRVEGVGVYTRRLLAGLTRHAPELAWKLIVPEDLAEAGNEAAPGKTVVAPVFPRFRRSLLREIGGARAVSAHLQRIAPDALLLCTYDFHSFSPPGRVCQVIHDCLPERFPQDNGGGLLRRWYRQRCLAWARGADRVLTGSQWSARDLETIGRIAPERIAVVPAWLDTPFAQRPNDAQIASVRERLGLPASYLLYVGGFRRYKAVDRLLQAYALARRSASLPPLVLAGRIPAAPARTRSTDINACLASLGLDRSAVLCPGFIPDADLPAVYAGAKLFVYPSLHEGFGYSPAEAIAMGTPVLVSNRASLPEVAPARNCQFDPDNTDELAAKIQEAVAAPAQFLQASSLTFQEPAGISRFVAALAPLLSTKSLSR